MIQRVLKSKRIPFIFNDERYTFTFLSLFPYPSFTTRSHTCAYVTRIKDNFSRSFEPRHVIPDTRISSGQWPGVTSMLHSAREISEVTRNKCRLRHIRVKILQKCPTTCNCIGQFIILLFYDCSTCFEQYYRSSSGASKLWLQLLVLLTFVVAGCHGWTMTAAGNDKRE
jgi:hypothetical protein